MRLILALLLMTLTAPAWAEWVEYGKSMDGTTYYLDPTTIEKNGSLHRAGQLQDLKQPFRDSLSQSTLHEYDCTERRARVLSFTAFSGNMGRGKVIYTDNKEGPWKEVPPESPVDTSRSIVCQ